MNISAIQETFVNAVGEAESKDEKANIARDTISMLLSWQKQSETGSELDSEIREFLVFFEETFPHIFAEFIL